MEKKEREVKIYEIPEWYRMQNVPNLLRVGERLTKKEKPAASEKKGREVAANV